MREPRSAEGARSLHGLPAPQSPSCDPSREGRPGRVGGGGRGGGRLPHRHLREALLVRSRRRLVQRLRAPEREKEGGTEAPRAAPSPGPGSAAGPSRRGGRTLVLRAAGGASSSVAERRRCLRAARRVCSLLCFFCTRRSYSFVRRRPSRLSVCPPTACSVLAWLLRASVLRVAMRSAAGPGRTGQGARGARPGAGA